MDLPPPYSNCQQPQAPATARQTQAPPPNYDEAVATATPEAQVRRVPASISSSASFFARHGRRLLSLLPTPPPSYDEATATAGPVDAVAGNNAAGTDERNRSTPPNTPPPAQPPPAYRFTPPPFNTTVSVRNAQRPSNDTNAEIDLLLSGQETNIDTLRRDLLDARSEIEAVRLAYRDHYVEQEQLLLDRAAHRNTRAGCSRNGQQETTIFIPNRNRQHIYQQQQQRYRPPCLQRQQRLLLEPEHSVGNVANESGCLPPNIRHTQQYHPLNANNNANSRNREPQRVYVYNPAPDPVAWIRAASMGRVERVKQRRERRKAFNYCLVFVLITAAIVALGTIILSYHSKDEATEEESKFFFLTPSFNSKK